MDDDSYLDYESPYYLSRKTADRINNAMNEERLKRGENLMDNQVQVPEEANKFIPKTIQLELLSHPKASSALHLSTADRVDVDANDKPIAGIGIIWIPDLKQDELDHIKLGIPECIRLRDFIDEFLLAMAPNREARYKEFEARFQKFKEEFKEETKKNFTVEKNWFEKILERIKGTK